MLLNNLFLTFFLFFTVHSQDIIEALPNTTDTVFFVTASDIPEDMEMNDTDANTIIFLDYALNDLTPQFEEDMPITTE